MLLTRLLRRSIENPSTPLSAPDDWLGDALGSFKSSAGTRVNRETAITLSAMWRGVNLISRDTGKLPTVVEKRAGAGWERAVTHPAYSLLRHKPNDAMTAMVFKQTLQGHALLDGNGYGYIWRLGSGAPSELTVLAPRQVTPVRANGQLWYVYQFLDGSMRKLPAEDVIHIKGFSYDGLIGYNLVHKARESLGGAMARETYGNIFFRNSSRPSVVLQTPKSLSEKARKNLAESWERLYSGLENAHRTAILEEGLTAKELTINARDSQLAQMMKMDLIHVANFLCIPVHKVGGEGRTAYNSLEQENQAYLDEGLDPWLVSHEEEYRDKLLTEEEKATDSHRVRFERKELLRANLEARGNYYVRGRQWGWLTANDIHQEEGMNPVEGDAGDTYLLPLNMTTVKAGETIEKPASPTPATPPAIPPVTPPEPPPDSKDRELAQLLEQREQQRKGIIDVTRAMLHSVVRRMVERIGRQAEEAAGKPQKFLDWIEQIEAKNGGIIRENLLPTQQAMMIVGLDGSAIGEWLLGEVRGGYLEMSGGCSAPRLAGETARLTARMLEELPQAAGIRFLR